MIVKIVPNRQDGQSNFGSLAKYITAGMNTGALTDLAETQPGFGQLTKYVAQEADGAGNEKCVAVALNHLLSVGTAASEFYSVSSKNLEVENPVIHLIVSWPEHERPSVDKIFDAGRDVLKALNLHEHQSLIAIHNDTDNLHCHIEVNRVHPVTFKSQHLPWIHKTLSRTAREIEIKNGWDHYNGLFVVRELPDGRKFVVPNERYRGGSSADDQPYVEKIGRMGAWTDERSLVDHCRDKVAPQITNAIVGAEASWVKVHETLAMHGMRIEKTGDKAFRLEACNEAGEIIRLPISKALRNIKFAEAETLLGKFTLSAEPLKPPQANTSQTTVQVPPRPSKRDPVKREARRLERAAERTALIERYRADQRAVKEDREHYKQKIVEVSQWQKGELGKLKAMMAARKSAIESSGLDSSLRKSEHSLAALERLSEASRIVAEAEARKAIIVAQRPAPVTWRSWLEQEAQSGDQAALAALRGLVYQEGREAKGANIERSGEDDGADAEEVLARVLAGERAEDAIWSDQPNRIRAHEADALMREVQGLKWRVTNNGNVEYRRENGQAVYVDRGNKITFDRKTVTDQDLTLALFHAREKWGKGIVLTAGDDAFTARMVKAAVAAGITVKNPELQQMQAFFKKQKIGESQVSKGRARKEGITKMPTHKDKAVESVQSEEAVKMAVGPTPVKPTARKAKRSRR